MSAVQGFGAELEVVVSAPHPRPPEKGLGEGVCGRGGGGFPSRCDWHSCIQGRGGRGTLVEAECPSLASPPPPPAFALLTGAVFVHSVAFINVFIYTLQRPSSL